ncbi:MAG: HEAT repeat domain-containing protein [Pyrinomonadaceae bacterium]
MAFKMGHPVFEITQNYDEAKKQLTLSVKQTQKIDATNEFPQVEFFQTWVDVEIDNKIERVWLKPQAENVYTFASAAKPLLVSFDNEGTLIKELKFDKSTDELVYQFQNDKDVLGRHWAMEQIAKRFMADATPAADKTKIFGALTNAINKETSWRLRREIINGIPTGENRQNQIAGMFGDAAPAPKFPVELTSALVAAAKDQNPNVRAAAIAMLARTKDAQFANLYFASLNDQSYSCY